jgi:flagellar motility protein MotE (MotC chaperone)
MDASEEQNIKKLSTWVQGMDAPTAANLIRTMADNGKMDVAVRLLANFEEREASKVLAALNNPELMAELADKFRTLQRPTKTADKRK